MCRIVVRWIDKPDLPGETPNRKQFDPVAVLLDGQDPGSNIGYPTYMIFDLAGLAPEAAMFLLEPIWGGDLDPDSGRGKQILKRTGFGMAWTRTPTPIQNEIIAAYEANEPYVIWNVTEEDLLNWFDKKV